MFVHAFIDSLLKYGFFSDLRWMVMTHPLPNATSPSEPSGVFKGLSRPL